jgi:hypothetical protein
VANRKVRSLELYKIFCLLRGHIGEFFHLGASFCFATATNKSWPPANAIPFGLAAVELGLTEILPLIWHRQRNSLQVIGRVHRFLTRNTHEE